MMKKIIVAGGTGFIGKELSKSLSELGYDVSLLSRNQSQHSEFKCYIWNPEENKIDVASLADKDIIINLCGANIADRRWSEKRKEILYASRIGSTRLLVDTILKNNLNPSLFINTSAIGFYGNRPGEKLSEVSSHGNGFLSELCQAWEKEVIRLEERNIPTAILRIGIVLSEKGGSLPVMIIPFRFGLNVVFDKGQQYTSWIHLKDLIQLFTEIIDNNLMPGIYNAVAPNPVSQMILNNAICETLNKRAFQIKIPKKILAIMMGEMISLLTDDQYVEPKKLMVQNFKFQFPEIANALNNILRKNLSSS